MSSDMKLPTFATADTEYEQYEVYQRLLQGKRVTQDWVNQSAKLAFEAVILREADVIYIPAGSIEYRLNDYEGISDEQRTHIHDARVFYVAQKQRLWEDRMKDDLERLEMQMNDRISAILRGNNHV